MHILFLFGISLLIAASDFQIPGLEISTIGARDELPIGIIAGEPCLEIILFGSGIIERPRDNIDNLVRELEEPHKLLRSGDHLLVQCPGVLRLSQDKLLDFLKLMDSEDAPRIFPMGSGLLPEAGRRARVLNRQRFLVDPFLAVVC